ncbi:MAG: hypothetical protein HWD86_02600 [Kangiellaceae bacterium]|nr:hypothetical protein [Kangiellaceae bacterium]
MKNLLIGLFLLSASSSVIAGNSGVSGTRGDFSNTLSYYDSYKLQSFNVNEKLDRPCYVSAILRGTNGTVEETTNNCYLSPNHTSVSAVGLFYGKIETLQVCHSKSGRVKGYKITGTNQQGLPDTDFYKRANCSKWKNTVSCPSGEIANGLRAYFKGASFNKSDILVGLQLLCRIDN